MNSLVTMFDLKEISVRLRKFSKEVIRVKINATKEDILRICNDEKTHRHIDIISSVSVIVNDVKFELVKKEVKK